MIRGIAGAALATALTLSTSMASATIQVVFDGINPGVASFNSTVAGAGGTASADNWTGLPGFQTSIDRGAYTVSRNNGAGINATTYSVASSSPHINGQVIDISPSDSSGDFRGSGIKFTFDSAVNAIGFEVGDWGTCCQPSALYISFDGGAPIQVGLSEFSGDVFLTDGGPGVFIAAFDDSGEFTTVEFWGDGDGEYLVVGGTIRYALLDEGSLGVPEPSSLLLFAGGLAGLALRRRRKTTH